MFMGVAECVKYGGRYPGTYTFQGNGKTVTIHDYHRCFGRSCFYVWRITLQLLFTQVLVRMLLLCSFNSGGKFNLNDRPVGKHFK